MARSNDALYTYLTVRRVAMECTVTYAHHSHDIGWMGQDGPEWSTCPGVESTPSVDYAPDLAPGHSCRESGCPTPDDTPSVDADYPPARVGVTWSPGWLIERRKANNVNQAIEFLNAAGRRAGDR